MTTHKVPADKILTEGIKGTDVPSYPEVNQGLPPLNLRAKVYLSGLTLLPGKDAGVKADFMFVSRGDRNATWASATPIGTLSMTVQNPAAAQRLEEFMRAARATGKQPELFLDLGPSEDGWPGDGHAFRLGEFAEGTYQYGKCGECGMGKDDDLVRYDQALGKNVTEGKAHPNG